MTNTTATPLTVDLAEQLIRRMTDGLVNIVDTTGEFLLHRELRFLLSQWVLKLLGSRGWFDYRHERLGWVGMDTRRG